MAEDPRNHRASEPFAPATGGQRCRLAVLFCDLSGSTALSSDMEAEDYAELLGALRQLYAAAVEAHGGTLVRIQGDGMLAIFGWPQAREGDSRRAVETAVQLHQQVAALRGFGPQGRDVDLRLHSGIHGGLVLVQLGDAMVGSLDLLGMAPNVAGRLSDAAGRDEILVSEDCLGPDLHHFNTGPARAVTMYGSAAPLMARAIHGRDANTTTFEARTRRRLQPFIGRQAELRVLDQALGQMLGGNTRRLALVAAPGVGKTRLAHELMQRARNKGCRVLMGHGTEALSDAPLQPLIEMLRNALPARANPDDNDQTSAALHRLLNELQCEALLPALSELLGLVATGARAAPQAALLGFFETLAQAQPLVLFVDDWQWADAATRQLLSTLGRDRAGLPVLMLATARDLDDGDARLYGIEQLALAPFTPAETTESVRQLLPQADPFLATEIRLYSGGNPLYVEELCRSARNADPERWLVRRLAGGNWLHALVESRIARLSADQAELLRLAAVIGSNIPHGLLQALTGRNADDPALLALADEDLLFADDSGGFHFKHGLTRDVVYQSVGLHQRRALHNQVAQALLARTPAGAEPPHEALATHCLAAGRAADAALHAEVAADRAAAQSVLDRARSLYHLALGALTQIDPDGQQAARWLAISERLGLVSVFDGARADLPVFERGVTLARASGDAERIARAEHSMGYVLYALGESSACISHLQRASAAAGSGDDPLAVQIRATLGQAQAAAADYPAAQTLLDEAVAIKRRHRRAGRNSVGLAYALVCLAAVHGDRGAFDLAHTLLDEAWTVVDGPGHQIGASIQGWRSAILCWQGRWIDAREVAQESARIAERSRSLFQFCQGRVTAAYADWQLSGDPRFLVDADQATGWLEPRESGLFRSLNHGWLVDGWINAGQRDKARRHAALALRRERAGDLIGVAMTCRALARDAASSGDAARAARWLSRAEAVALRRQSAHETACNQLCAAQLAALADQPAQAQRLAAWAQQAFSSLQMADHARQALALQSA